MAASTLLMLSISLIAPVTGVGAAFALEGGTCASDTFQLGDPVEVPMSLGPAGTPEVNIDDFRWSAAEVQLHFERLSAAMPPGG